MAITNTYAYDAANRLVSVDSVPYTWDAEFAAVKPGNLLSISTTLRALYSEVTACNTVSSS